MSEYKDKVVVVTGASQGIGLQVVKEFAKAEAKVIMVAYNKAEIDKAIDSIEVNKHLVEGMAHDLSN